MHGGGNVLWELFIALLVARLAGEAFARLRQPALLGEVLAGVLLGSHALGVIGTSADSRAVFAALSEIGVVLLLFEVGLESPMGEFQRTGARAAAVGAAGVVLPFVLGAWTIDLLGHSTRESLFAATAMVATSTGVTARVLRDLHATRSRVSRIIVGAALVDDVLALLLLAVVSQLEGGSAAAVALIVVQALAFIAGVLALGLTAFRRYSVRLARIGGASTAFWIALMLALGLAAAASAVGLAAIIGAALAGVLLSESEERRAIERGIAPLVAFFVPFFFIDVGAQVDLNVLRSPGGLALAAVVTGVAIVGKLAGVLASMAGTRWLEALSVAFGMVPRAEAGLAIAGLGLADGLIGPDIFAAVVTMSVVTTLVAPLIVAPLVRRLVPQPPPLAHGPSPAGDVARP